MTKVMSVEYEDLARMVSHNLARSVGDAVCMISEHGVTPEQLAAMVESHQDVDTDNISTVYSVIREIANNCLSTAFDCSDSERVNEMHKTITLVKGESLTITLPSGKEINIEATADTADVLYENNVLFNE